MTVRAHVCSLATVAVLLVVHTDALAQTGTLGIGPRFSFVRGNVRQDVGSSRYSGGVLRAALSRRVSLELSLDYRSHLNDSLTERVRNYPVQGSLLMYPVKSTLSPYLVFGAGWYSQRVEQVDSDSVIEPVTTRTVGYHAGMGGEIRVGRRTAVHLDYRYTFIRFGTSEDSSPGAIPLPGLGALQDRLKLSHQGSMWTTGVTVYF